MSLVCGLKIRNKSVDFRYLIVQYRFLILAKSRLKMQFSNRYITSSLTRFYQTKILLQFTKVAGYQPRNWNSDTYHQHDHAFDDVGNFSFSAHGHIA